MINKFLNIHDERTFIVTTLTTKIGKDWERISEMIYESHNNKTEANIKFSLLNELHDIKKKDQIKKWKTIFIDKIKRICFNEHHQQNNAETSDSDSDDDLEDIKEYNAETIETEEKKINRTSDFYIEKEKELFLTWRGLTFYYSQVSMIKNCPIFEAAIENFNHTIFTGYMDTLIEYRHELIKEKEAYFLWGLDSDYTKLKIPT